MTTQLTHDEIYELLAVYALDAVDGDEAETIELHLRECPRCRAEVTDHRETAAALATGHEPAPVHLWDSIVSTLEEAPPIELARVLSIRSSRTRRTLQAAVVMAAAVVMTVVGVRVVQQGDQINRMQSALEDRTVLAAALAAHGNPDARHAELLSADGIALARVVLVPDGTGYLWGEGLPSTVSGRTYQLWAIVGTKLISAGVLGPNPGVVPFRIAGDVIGLAITEEVAGGVVASKNQPIASGLIVEA